MASGRRSLNWASIRPARRGMPRSFAHRTRTSWHRGLGDGRKDGLASGETCRSLNVSCHEQVTRQRDQITYPRVAQPVVDHDAVLAVGGQALVAQDHQLLRHIRLPLLQDCREVADAALAALSKDLQDAQARGVGQRADHVSLLSVSVSSMLHLNTFQLLNIIRSLARKSNMNCSTRGPVQRDSSAG